MTNVPVEVITSLQGRPRWSRAEKGRVLAASLAPGGCVGVARGPGAEESAPQRAGVAGKELD